MCTVSFIPFPDKVIITSNRDVQTRRLPAMEPAVHRVQGSRVLFPRDSEAGGTWFTVHENGEVAVLLNGAWENHEHKPPYRKSRGLILLDLVGGGPVVDEFAEINLQGIEPFTLVIWEHEKLYENRWDGSQKYARQKDASAPHIWSSVTLYNDETSTRRIQWFSNWLLKNPSPEQEQVVDFHRFSGNGDQHNDLLMNRDGIVSTASISSVAISQHSAQLRHIDIHRGQSSFQEFLFSKAIANKS